MRLVNKEFEEKVSQYLFRTVVVPFRPEIYGITEEHVIDGWWEDQDVPSSAAVMLQDKGMRVFQGFGRHIHKFAMSFEFDYELLTKPPVKSDQEAITTFWGIYRWPLRKYNRYAQLEGLEQIADETRTMTKALRFIENSRELGLSIDGGLGWLSGPDINPNVLDMREKVKVFGDSRFPLEDRQNTTNFDLSRSTMVFNSAAQFTNVDPIPEAGDEAGHTNAFVRMLSEAGYQGFDLTQSVRTLMESEGLPQPSQPFSETSSLTSSNESPNVEDTERLFQHFNHHEGSILERMRTFLNIHDSARQSAGPNNNPIESISTIISPAELKYFSLKPNDLTNAQKEMLLETEWAQRAFLQSYAIAIIDNPRTFRNIVSLTIARLPSRHLAILMRNDFWTCLSKLNKVSLAVIPDWRDIIKLPTSRVEDIRLPPSQAISSVYRLLKDHIAPHKSIESFRFEWLCGGEEATGLFARNQLILAAPLVPQAMDMLKDIGPTTVLGLPFIKHLTLKNCWISPHIFVRFVASMKTQALQSLTLHSISLSAPARQNALSGHDNPAHVPAPMQYVGNTQTQAQQAMHVQAVANLMQIQGMHAGGAQTFVPGINMPQAIQPQMGFPQPIGLGQVQQATSPDSWLEKPRDGSWAQVIDSITPFSYLASRYSRDIDYMPPIPEPTSLKRIDFDSCGYVRLPLDLDQRMLDQPNPAPIENGVISKRRNELEQYMMKPHEHTLGTIVNFISENETWMLESTWNLRIGWGTSKTKLALKAMADGIKEPGQGRFSGTIVT
jgi:hypothetical protein